MSDQRVYDLRPYYDPDTFDAGYLVVFKPGVGLIDTHTRTPLWQQVFGAAAPGATSSFKHGTGIGIHSALAAARDSPGTYDKNYMYDLEMHEYFDTFNIVELLKNLGAGFLRSYCRILLGQPLDIVRLILQVGELDVPQNATESQTTRSPTTTQDEEEDDDEIVQYFKPRTGQDISRLPQSEQSIGQTLELALEPAPSSVIKPISRHTIDIATAIFAKDGPVGVFRGINASFIYHTLSHTVEAWITGFCSPWLGVPDPFFLELTHLNDPAKSLWLSLAASVLSGLLLMPLDLIRVKLMITNLAGDPENNRLVRESVRHFPSARLTCSPSILVLTILHQLLLTVFRKAAPYAMFVKFNINAYGLPSTYTLANLFWLVSELFIKLPIENLLRKEQVRYLLQPKDDDKHNSITIRLPHQDLLVPVNSLYTVANMPLWERIKSLRLFDGWRVGLLNVVAFWGYNILKGSRHDAAVERL